MTVPSTRLLSGKSQSLDDESKTDHPKRRKTRNCNMITEQQLAEIIAFGREQHYVEFKGPGLKTDKQLLTKVIRAMIGMANRRDGGLVIIGVNEVEGRLDVVGLNAGELATWKHDHLADSVYAYSDPTISFDTGPLAHDGATVLVIEVHQFDDVPVLCKKSYGDVLSEGALYIRGRRKPETTLVRSVIDMRDLLDLSTEKYLRRMLGTLKGAGIDMGKLVSPSDEERFSDQLGELK